MSQTDATENAGVTSVLRVEGLTKQFGATLALDDVELTISPGEIHALVGENGAGKSTLIKILAGVYVPDDGSIALEGEMVDPRHSQLPIAFIHQDLGLIEGLSVKENIALVGGYDRARGLISWKQLSKRAEETLALIGSDLDPDSPVSELTAAERSVVALTRALTLVQRDKLPLLVLDEPTASLPEQEVAILFGALERLRRLGVAMIYVTHRMDEVKRLSDRVSVLRDGRNVVTAPTATLSTDEIVQHIVGRPLAEVFISPRTRADTNALIEMEDVCVQGAGPASFSIDTGEIVALVGLIGAGHDRIGRALFGAQPVLSGRARLSGKTMSFGSVEAAVAANIGFVSSRRADESIAPALTVRENLYLNKYLTGGSPLRPVNRRGETAAAEAALERFDIRPRDTERQIETLSGGNQQKAVLARWILSNRDVLILEEPTIGVDVGAKAEIYRTLSEFTEEGGAIALVSSDYEEVVGIAHRAFVFNRGKVVAEVAREQMSVETITKLAGQDPNGE
jgi:ribose transport system ATP-binding protein